MGKVKQKYVTPLLQLYDINKNFICNLTNRNLKNSAFSIKKKTITNDVKTLTFSIPFDNIYINTDSCEDWIKFEFDWYIIKNIKLSSSDVSVLEVYCEDEFVISKSTLCQPIELIGMRPKDMFDGIMNSAEGNLGYVFKGSDIASYRSLVVEEETSVFENLIAMAQAFNCVIEFSRDVYGNKMVYFRAKPYERGLLIRKGYNSTDVNIEYDTTELFTRLMPFGEPDEFGIETNIFDVNPTGKAYIEDYSYFRAKGMTDEQISSNPQCQALTIRRYENIFDPNELFTMAMEELKRICKPKVTGDANFYNLSVLEDSSMMEPFTYEKVIIVDETTKMRFESLIQEIELDYDNILESAVTFSDEITYNTVFKELVSAGEKIEKITTTNTTTGKTSVIASTIKGKIDSAVTQIGTMLDTIDAPEADYAILFEDRRLGSALYGALAIGTRGILIAHELNEDNTWNWTTAIDSQGINASNVTTGTLLADIIKAGTLSDINGNSWINMEDGTFSLANGQLTFDGSEFIVKIGSNKIDDLLNASFNVITNKEHIVVTLDTNSFPVEDVNHTITFRVLQGNTTSETPCIINKITPSNEIEGVNFTINNNSCTMSISKETRLFGIVEESFEVELEIKDYKIFKTITWSTISQGRDGQDGANGTPGVSSYFHIKYAPNDNPTADEMTETVNTYIGTYVDEIKEDSNDPTKYTWSKLVGEDGKDGKDGIVGKDGEDGVSSYLHIKYSDDMVSFTENNGETPGIYMGQYVDEIKEDSLVFNDYVWAKIKGEDGKDGTNGTPGASSYFHVKYAPNNNPTPEQMTDTPQQYIGTYVDDNIQDSDDPRKYTWIKIQGQDGTSISIDHTVSELPDTGIVGEYYYVTKTGVLWRYEDTGWVELGKIQGEQGIPGKDGENGKTNYLHIRYSNDNGVTFTTNNGEDVGMYMGTYVDFTEEDSSNVNDYKWVRLKGEDGSSASYVKIISNNNLFVMSKGSNEYSPSNIVLTPEYTNCTFGKWQYSTDGGTDWTMVTNGLNGLTISSGILTINNNSPLFTEEIDNISFKVTASDGSSDIVTVARLKDGIDGDDGVSATNVFLTNENHTFMATNDGKAIATSISFDVNGYVGIEEKSITFGTITGVPNGMNITKNGSNSTNAKLTISVTTDMTSLNGTITIPCICNGITFNKQFSYALSVPGKDGQDGINGTNGINGTSSYFHIKYAPVENPTANQMTETVNTYIGTYVDNNIADSNNPSDYKWSKFVGQDGNNGNDGLPGKDGKDGTTYYLHVKYSNDGSTFTANSGETPGDYLGQLVDTNKEDSLVFNDYTWKKIKGEDGNDGISGTSSYFHIKYSPVENPTASQMTEVPSDYIGTYVDEIKEDSNDPSKYTWSRFKGQDGNDGEQGLPGEKGKDGTTYYLHIKYSDNGTTFTANNGETPGKYLGQLVDTTEEDSLVFSDYTWKKIEGDVGANASYVKIIANNQAFLKPSDSQTYSPSSIKLTPVFTNSTYSKWQYSTNNGSNWTDVTSGSNGLSISSGVLTISNTCSLYTDSIQSISFKVLSKDSTVYDVISILKLKDGSKGEAGITILLDNESHIFNATIDGKAEATTLTINVLGYKGTTAKSCTIGTISGLPTGMTSAINNNNTTSVNIKLTLTDSMVTKNGTITIPVTCDGVTINKKFSYSLSIPGKDGYSHNYNLVKNSAFLYGKEPWSFSTNVTLDNAKTFNGHPSCKSSQSGLTDFFYRGCYTYNLPNNPTTLKQGETYTFSCYYYVEDKSTFDSSLTLSLRGKKVGETATTIVKNVAITLDNIVEGEWNRIVGTSTLEYDLESARLCAFVNKNGTAWFADFKMEEGSKATKWVACPEDTETYVDNLVADLQEQLDGKIQTYSQNNDPSTNWTTTEKTNHEGDIWYNTDTKNTYRWSGTAWVLLQNAEAENAKEIAQSKAQVFTSRPTIPYYEDDLWITALDGTGVVKTCIKDRTSGEFTDSEWVESLKYTDDTFANQLKSEIDKLSFGSRNYFRYGWTENQSVKENLSDCWTTYQGSFTRSNATSRLTDDYNFCLSMPYNSQYTYCNANLVNKYRTIEMAQGTEVTLSMYLVMSSNCKGYTIRAINDENTETVEFTDIISGTTNPTGYKISKTFNIPYNKTSIRIYNNGVKDTSVTTSSGLFFNRIKLEKGNFVSGYSEAPEDTQGYVDNLVADLQDQLDGKIETYSQANDPNTNWTTTDLKTQHTGDIWYNTSAKLTYRWSGTAWVKLSNQEAIDANDLANSKAQVFTSEPIPPYKEGDLWVTALDGTGIVKTCIKDRTSGNYTASEWVENLKYTDDTLANQVQEELDNLSIGGRNYIQFSDFVNNTEQWIQSKDANNTGTTTVGSGVMTITSAGASYIQRQIYSSQKATALKELENGVTYTLSVEVMVEQHPSKTGTLMDLRANMLDGTTSTQIRIADDLTNVELNKWIKLEKTGTLNYDEESFNYWRVVIQGVLDGKIHFRKPKLEKGSRATDWCPAIEEYKGSSIHIQPSTNIFKYSGSAYSPNTITLTPILTNSTYSKWQYSINGGSSWTNVTSGSNGLTISNGILTIANTCNLYTSSVTSVTFKVIATGEEEISDVITIPRLKDGDKGADSVNIFLGNENHTFVASSDGKAVATSVSTSVLGYAGTTAKSCTIGTISGLPTGMTATINNNNSTSASITFAVTTSLTTKNGTVTIPVTCNGVTINKIFSYSLAVAGANGSSSKLIKINAPTNVFKSTDGGITFKPSSMDFTFSVQNATFSKWQYSINNGSSWTDVGTTVSGMSANGATLSITSSCGLFTESVTAISIKCLSTTSTVYDTLTIYKLYDRIDINEAFEEMELTVTQSNTKWEACFKNSNANNLFLNSDAKTGTTDEWVDNGGGLTISKANAFPFYGSKENYFKTSFKSSTSTGVRYKHDIILEPNTDYIYEGYIYTNVSVTGTDLTPLNFRLWTGTTYSNMRDELCTILDYRQTLTPSRFVKCYVHFKTNDVSETIYGRFFIYKESACSLVGFKRMSLKKGTIETEWTQHPNEVKSSVVSIDETGVNVKHSEIGTTTNMNSQGFSIMDTESGDVLAWLSSKEQWTELKVDKVFASNVENVYTGESNLYVDHSATVAGDGTSSKPFNSFAQLSNHLMSNPVINKDIYIVVRDPGFIINEQLYLERLKGTGFIKITLEGNLVIANSGSDYCIRLHQISKWVWIVSGREFGSNTTGAVLQDGGSGGGHGIYATDVERLEIDALTIACKNWGIHTERTHLYTWHIDFGKCYCAVELQCMSIYYSSDDVGSCTDFCRLKSGSFAYWGCGTVRPQGNVQKSNGMYYDGGISLTPTASPRYPSANPTPPSTSGQYFTKTYNCTSKQSYQYAWSNWSSDGSCKQGQWSGYGLRGGHMFFDMTTIRAEITGTIQDGNTITLTRANSGGISGDANVYINGSSCSSASGTPSYSNQTHLGTLKWGETKTFTLPKAIVQSLINGTCNSLAVYVNSTASNNYINITSASITLKTKK